MKNENEYDEFSNQIAQYIIQEKENNIVRGILNREYFYFSKEEKKIIYSKCIEILKSENIKETSKKELLKLLVLEYIEENQKLNIKGFINFRIKSYIEILEYVVEIAVEKFVLEKEYIELINILKEYVNNEKKKVEKVHLIYDGYRMNILDENFEELHVKGKIKYMSDFGILNNNQILNILLDIIPKKIIIHNKTLKEDTFLSTIEKIFSDNISYCKKCEKNVKEKKHKYCFMCKWYDKISVLFWKDDTQMTIFWIKIIACISMFLDHVKYAIGEANFCTQYLGRVAFPLFMFVMVEGYCHTRDVKKYLKRLFLAAIISQIPYQIFKEVLIGASGLQINVIATILVTMLCIKIYDKSFSKIYSIILITVIGCITQLLNFDYGIYGILIGMILYIFREKKIFKFVLFAILVAIYHYLKILRFSKSFILYSLCTCVAIIPMMLYNGKKGRGIKYFFYAFYPVHMILLILLEKFI